MRGAHFGNFRCRVRSSISLLFFLLTAAVWLEPGSCISLHHQNYESHRAPREAGTDPHSLQFDLLTDTTAECVERLGSNVSVELSYRTPSGDWETLRLLTRVPGDCDSVSNRETVQLPPDILNQTAIQFRWLQQEQAWHDCNCWQISNVSLTVNNSQLLSYFGDGANDDFACADSQASTGQLSCFTGGEGLVFCDGSASVPRGVVTPMYDLSTGGIVSGSCTASDLFEPIGNVQLCASDGANETFIDVNFQLAFQGSVGRTENRSCDALEYFDEGVEVAIRRSEDEQWVPLKFYTQILTRGERIDIGIYDQDNSILSLRGYNVSVVAGDTSVMSVTVNICDERFFQEGIQFRWLQTVIRDLNGVAHTARDSWFIDNVKITVHGSQNSSRTEFSDDFSAQFINETLWSQVRGAHGGTTGIDTRCVPEDSGGVLYFGTNDTLPNTSSESPVAVTRTAVTKPLNLVPEINECAEGRDDCDENAVCTDTDRSFTCTCQDGYTANGAVCTNIDECTVGIADCDMNADCADNDGSFTCLCREGYTGSGTDCTNINECSEETDRCDVNAVCTDTVGSYNCTCRDGFGGDGLSCTIVQISTTSAAAITSSSTAPADMASSSTPLVSAAVTPTSVISSTTVLSSSDAPSTTVASTPPSATPTPTPTQTSQVPSETLQMFADLFNDTAEVRPSAVLSTLQDMLGNLSAGSTFPLNTSQLLLDSLSDLIDTVQQSDSDADNTTGSTLLYVLDRFALGPYDPEQGELEDTSNIDLVHMVLNTSNGDPSDQVEVIAINGNRIVLPREVFMNCNATEVSVASYFYHSLGGLLPDSLPGDSQNSTTTMKLNSSILSSALQCGSMQFDARNLNLTNPVVITFSHPQGLEQRDGRTTSFICVFWEFDDFFTNGLIGGHWSTEGCTRNVTASNENRTVCECNHLTHFALLLSTTSEVMQEQSVAVQVIMDLFNDTEEVPRAPSEILVTLGGVLRNLSAGITFPPEVSEQLFTSVSDLIDTVQQMDNNGDGSTDIGSTLLDVMDRFALGPYDPEQGELEDTDNIALVHMVQSTSSGDPVEGISRNGSRIVLPGEVFMNVNRPEVPVASYYYRNMSGLLPDSIPGDTQNSTTTMRLASPILSSALQCGSAQCNTRDLNLTNPVVLVFHHSPELVDDLGQQDGRESSVICVFLNLNDSSANGLISGQWATEGCTRNDTASNKSQTVCECNHLTHFALLLSTTEISLTPAETLSLRIIGIICVTISLICLTATILTFLFLKSLWSMRNYIHINLCTSLFIAQLIFIVAVEPHGSVIGCQAVAVLLHYFFLVTFMWMLMEGVVLYVALVRVFIKFKNRYLIAFTLASYGIPLLYLGITVPLGFVLDNADGPHYAGDDPQSCWLRYDTHFTWAFIAPVIVIILANIGFFIMAVTIMYRHQRRQTHKSRMATLKHWLKASISLVIVMGITWIIGILVFNRHLLFVAYIYTIFIGLQGLIIFILFVVLSKQVREEYIKWWKVKVASSDFLSRHFSHTTITSVSSPSDKSKSLDKNVPPTLELIDNSHNVSPLKEVKESNSVFDLSLIQGVSTFSSDQIGGEVPKDTQNEEALAEVIVNTSVLALDNEGRKAQGERGT